MPSEVSYTGSHTNTDSFHSIVYSIIPVQLWGQLFRAFSHPANKNVGINWILVIFGMYIVKYFGIKSLPFKLCLNDQYWPWQSHVRPTQIQPLIWLHFGKVPSTLQGQKAQRYMTEGKKKLLLDYFIIFSTQKRALDNFFGKTKHRILR